MTIEEKAKAYDEALKRAKAMHDVNYTDSYTKANLEIIFPQLAESEDPHVIDIPFGAYDSELKGWEYTIPEGMEAVIEDGKIIVREQESEDERIRKALIWHLKAGEDFVSNGVTKEECIAYLEKQKINTEGDFGRGYDSGYQAGYSVAKNEMKPKVATAALDSEEQKKQSLRDFIDDFPYSDQQEKKPAELSDNERIRKCLLDIVNWLGFDSIFFTNNSVTKKDAIFWLEKQKEQEPITDSIKFEEGFKTGREFERREQKDFRKLYEDIAKSEWFKKAYHEKSLGTEDEQKEQKPVDNEKVEITDFEQSVYDLCPVLGIEEAKATASDLLELAKKTLLKTGKVVLASNYPEGCSFEDGFHLGYSEGFNAKKEQKPVEIDGKALLHVSNKSYDIGFRDGVASVKPAEWSDDIIQKAVKEVGLTQYQIDWFKTNVFPPKQEWSEEDKKNFYWISTRIQQANMTPEYSKEVYAILDWLKSFCSQPKSNWSEEDEKDVAHIIRILDDCYDYRKHDLSKTDHENLVNKLKSLYPQSYCKPNEWNREDKSVHNYLCDLLRETWDKVDKGSCIDDAISWLEELPTRVSLSSCKPSEDEERLIKTSISFLKDFADKGYENAVECIDWLKSFLPQSKAKLTLLDENIINAAVAFVEQNDHFNCWGGIDKHTVIKALRSLKTYWKPSEEQMEALNSAQFIYAHGLEHGDTAVALESLYHDLEKLM